MQVLIFGNQGIKLICAYIYRCSPSLSDNASDLASQLSGRTGSKVA